MRWRRGVQNERSAAPAQLWASAVAVGGQATCKDCQGDEGAAARAAQQQRELQSFLFAESDGALDGKKRSFKGVERRAAMPSAAIKNAAKAEFKLGGAHRQTLAQPSLHTYVLVSKSD